jgi:hypothetical protein
VEQATFAVLALAGLMMLFFVRHRETGCDGICHALVLLSNGAKLLSRLLMALAAAEARFREGLDAAAVAGRVEMGKAWRESR